MSPFDGSPSRHDGAMPTNRDLRDAARVLRHIVEATTGLPDDSLADAQLRDRLELAAAVLAAAVGTTRYLTHPK